MTNTLTKAYQGRTYLATLATTGREVVITVEAGYTRNGGGEVARLQALAQERYGFPVAGCQEQCEQTFQRIPEEDRGSGRCWAIELKRPMTRVEYAWDGEPFCYGDVETDYERVVLRCPGLIPAYMGQLRPEWEVTDFCESNTHPEDLEPCPF